MSPRWWFVLAAIVSFLAAEQWRASQSHLTVTTVRGGAVVRVGAGVFVVCGDANPTERDAVMAAQSGYFWVPRYVNAASVDTPQTVGGAVISPIQTGLWHVAHPQATLLCGGFIDEDAPRKSTRVNLKTDGWILTAGGTMERYPLPKWVVATMSHKAKKSLLVRLRDGQVPLMKPTAEGGFFLRNRGGEWALYTR